jgi:hypothetical protein
MNDLFEMIKKMIFGTCLFSDGLLNGYVLFELAEGNTILIIS